MEGSTKKYQGACYLQPEYPHKYVEHSGKRSKWRNIYLKRKTYPTTDVSSKQHSLKEGELGGNILSDSKAYSISNFS